MRGEEGALNCPTTVCSIGKNVDNDYSILIMSDIPLFFGGVFRALTQAIHGPTGSMTKYECCYAMRLYECYSLPHCSVPLCSGKKTS
jgi:hypothetical protein